LKVPSGDASGLKIHLNPPLEVVDEADAEILIDFDVSRSFIMQGNLHHGVGKVKGFIFKPVVRAVAHVQTETGKVSGTVKDEEGDEIENALLTLIEGTDDTITSARTDDDGFYRMTGILPGDYLLVCSKEDEDATADITVEAGEETGQDFELSLTGEVEGDDDGDDGD